MNRDRIIRNLKTGSTCVTVLCFVLLAVNLYGTFAVFGLEPYSAAQDGTRFQTVEICARFALSALMLLLSALMFLRLARNGRPFSQKNVRTVCVIGILFLLSTILPTLIGNLATGFRLFGEMHQQFIRVNDLVGGIILLLTAYVMHYGTALQQESDETL